MCVCQNRKERGYIGMDGVIWAASNVRRPWKRIERCDQCRIYKGDVEAALAFSLKKNKVIKILPHEDTFIGGIMVVTK